MLEEIQKTLGDLYAIRATMSVVAQNDDKSEPDRKEISRLNSRIRELESDISQRKSETESKLLPYSLETKYKEYKEEKKELEDELKEIKKEYQKEESTIYTAKLSKEQKKAAILLPCVCIPLLGLFVTMFYFMELSLLMYISIILNAGSLVIGETIILCMWISEKRHADYMNDKDKLKLAVMSETEGYNEMIMEKQKQMDEIRALQKSGVIYEEGHEEIIAPVQQELQDEVDEIQKQISALNLQIPKHQTAVHTIVQQSKAIIDSAVKAYPVIDFRDWGNVDLLIYYFETGRAESVKEALQLVDRQRQTDQITKALAMASAEISRTIRQSMVQLGSALAQSFGVLSSQLAAQHNETMQGMAEQAAAERAAINEQTAAIERQTAIQVSAQEMNAALLNKIYTSSSRLAQQVDRQMGEVYHLPIY